MHEQTEEVLRRVKEWPAPQRVELIHALLDTLGQKESAVADVSEADELRVQRRAALKGIQGLLSGPNPPPSDEELKQMIHEHRVRKYG